MKGVDFIMRRTEAIDILQQPEEPIEKSRARCDRCGQSWASNTKAFRTHVHNGDNNFKCFFRTKLPFFGKLRSQSTTDNRRDYEGRVFKYTTAESPDQWKMAMCSADPNIQILLDAVQTVHRGKWHELATGGRFAWLPM